MSPVVKTAAENTVTNGVETEVQHELSKVSLESSTEVQPLNGNNVDEDNPSLEKPESALEQLAKNLETIGKYKNIDNDVKEMDMIAFKIFTPNFEKSDYVIGLVESIIGRNAPEQHDFDLMLQIMGKR